MFGSFGRELAGSIDGLVVRSIVPSGTTDCRMRVPSYRAAAWGSCQEWATPWCIRPSESHGASIRPPGAFIGRRPRRVPFCLSSPISGSPKTPSSPDTARSPPQAWTRRVGPRDLWHHIPVTSDSRRGPRGGVFYSTPWTFLRLSQHPPRSLQPSVVTVDRMPRGDWDCRHPTPWSW